MTRKIHSWKFRCLIWHRDFKYVFKNLRHQKVAKWTLIIHIIYYIDSAIVSTGTHLITATACLGALTLELFSKDDHA